MHILTHQHVSLCAIAPVKQGEQNALGIVHADHFANGWDSLYRYPLSPLILLPAKSDYFIYFLKDRHTTTHS